MNINEAYKILLNDGVVKRFNGDYILYGERSNGEDKIKRIIKRRARNILEAMESSREYYYPTIDDITADDWVMVNNDIKLA